MNEETMVEMDSTPTDDTLTEDVVEEEMDESEPLEVEEEAPAEPVKEASEPGWIKQRVNKEVAKALARERENIRSEYEQQFAPLRERLLEMDAQELVRTGQVKDLETAKELVRYRQNIPPKEPTPRNEKGQFTQKEDVALNTRISMLAHQADTIKEKRGLDVMAEFSSNPDIKQKIKSGEIDFYDVAEMMEKPKKKAPSPMRSPNGARGIPNSIEQMSDEQFARMEKRIKEGARIRLK